MLPGLAGALHTRRAPHAPPQPRAPLTLSAVCLHGLGLCSVRCLLLFCQVSTLARLTLGPGHSLGRGGHSIPGSRRWMPTAPLPLSRDSQKCLQILLDVGWERGHPHSEPALGANLPGYELPGRPLWRRGRQILTGRAHLDSRGAHPPPRRGSAVALGKGAPCSFSAGDPGPSPISSPGKWGREVPGPPPQLTQAFPQNNALKPSVPGTGP